MQQAEDMRQSVEKMVDNSVIKKALCMTYMLTIITKHKQQEEMANTTKVTKSLLLMMVHLCKVWDNAFGVHRQQYFGGTFVGNHIHKALQVRIVIKYTVFFFTNYILISPQTLSV